MIDIQNIVYDGLILSACVSLFITITMWANPLIWLHDYPKDSGYGAAKIGKGKTSLAVTWNTFPGVVVCFSVFLNPGF